MKNLIERLLACWYALTKKDYVIFCYDRLDAKRNGACCITHASKDGRKIFFSAIMETLGEIEPGCRESGREDSE